MRNSTFCLRKNKGADQVISTFVFATQIVQLLYFVNPKFPVSSHLLWLYSLVYVGPAQKPRLFVFSCEGSHQENMSMKWYCGDFRI